MRTILVCLAALLPLAALAHPGDHSAVPPTHALTAPDHLAVLIALIVVAGLAYALWVRR